MQTIKDGQTYELEHMEGNGTTKIHFVEKSVDENGEFRLVEDGVSNEEVIEMLIDRINTLNEKKMRCRENSLAITKLEEALMWLEARTNRKKEQGKEGTNKE